MLISISVADCFPTSLKAHLLLLHNCGHMSVLHHWYVNHLAEACTSQGRLLSIDLGMGQK